MEMAAILLEMDIFSIYGTVIFAIRGNEIDGII